MLLSIPVKPNLEAQALFADTLRDAPMPTRERQIEILVGCSFIAAVALLWSAHPPGSFALLPAGLCLLMMALATRARFETPFGFTVATQLAFVPLLSALPIAIVRSCALLGRGLTHARKAPRDPQRTWSRGAFAYLDSRTRLIAVLSSSQGDTAVRTRKRGRAAPNSRPHGVEGESPRRAKQPIEFAVPSSPRHAHAPSITGFSVSLPSELSAFVFVYE